MHQIQEWWECAGLSPTDVAERSGIARSTLHRIVRGEVDPRMSTLREIALACDMDLELTLSPLSDPYAAAAARVLLGEAPSPGAPQAHPATDQDALQRWIKRLSRTDHFDPLEIVSAAARASTLLARVGAAYYRGPVKLQRVAAETDHASHEWALSGAPMLQGRGPTIVWADPTSTLHRLLLEHLEPCPARVENISLIVAPTYPGVLDGAFTRKHLRYVAPVQMVIDSLGIPGQLAHDARTEAERW